MRSLDECKNAHPHYTLLLDYYGIYCTKGHSPLTYKDRVARYHPSHSDSLLCDTCVDCGDFSDMNEEAE